MSSSHQIVLTSSPDGPITAYDASSGTILSQFTGSRSPRRGLALAGKAFIAASHISLSTASGSIHLYNWHSTTALHNLSVPEPVAPLAATTDGMYLFAGGLSGNIHALSIPSGEIIRSLSVHEKPVSCLKISEDGSLLISGGDDGSIVLLPIFQLVEASSPDENSTDFIFQKFSAHDESVTAIVSCISTIISCSMDCTCKFWSLLNGTLLHKVTFPCAILGLAVDPTETQFYAAGSDGSIYKGLMKIGRKQQMGDELVMLAQKHGTTVVSLVMTNEGKILVSAAEDGSVLSWDTETGEMISFVIGNHTCSISDMVVTNGIGDCKGHSLNLGIGDNDHSGGGIDFGLSAKMLIRTLKDTIDIEDVLMVAAKDRRKVIDMLESAIAMYERLLELILKEAKGGSSSSEKGKYDKGKEEM